MGKLLVIGIMFLLGLYYIYRSNDIETFAGKDEINTNYKIAEKCPDVLIQKGAALFLYNSKRANVPGINPIRFESLEEYVEFTDWQRSQGLLCPILYLQHAYNAQGESVYKARPSPTNLQGGQPDFLVTPAALIPPNIMPPPINVPIQGIYGAGNLNEPSTSLHSHNPLSLNFTPNYTYNGPDIYVGFDPLNQTIGAETPLDKMFNQTLGVSPNPMDHNWGGAEYTDNVVKAGYYKGNERSIAAI
jgi:hypothetical protein